MAQQEWPDFPAIPAPVKGALVALRDRMRAKFADRFLEARLFGSYARGEQHEESDVDVVLFFRSRLTDDEADSIYDEAAQVDVVFKLWLSPKVFAREQFDRMLAEEHQIAVEIENEGIRI